VEHKWTLIYKGKEKVYILTESRLLAGEWVEIARSEWTTLEAAITHMQRREVNA